MAKEHTTIEVAGHEVELEIRQATEHELSDILELWGSSRSRHSSTPTTWMCSAAYGLGTRGRSSSLGATGGSLGR